ncbi:MAG TPA: prolyl oligopeptidase family serine peptidase, partial [Saprospiraceae bacterium]|nr:prolyl oligopeptidase family serine peptidase [Saprospiraceae bacterium]
FSWELKTGATKQLTYFIKGNKRQEGKKADYDAYLERQQYELFEVLRDQKKQAKDRKTINEALKVKRPKDFFYGEKNIQNLSVDPNLQFVCITLSRQGDTRVAQVPNYISENGFTRDIPSREKVGVQQDSYEFLIYNMVKDTAFTFNRNKLPGIYQQPIFLKDYRPDSVKLISTNPKEVIYMNPVFSGDGKIVMEIKSQDHKDRWIILLNPDDISYKVLDHQHDEAWIGGPGISGWSEESGNIGWLADNETIWYQSEETGYSHIYTQNIDTGKRTQLTSGKFEILQVQLSRDKSNFYITSNKESPFEHHFYKMSVKGGEMKKITYLVGNNDVTMSPDEKYLAIRYSYANKPWELYLMENKAGAKMEQITKSTTKEFDRYNWRVPEIINILASDGAPVPARIYKPAKSNKAAIIFVHGAGYLQNVHYWWSNYFREYMFHNMLADNGYTVLDIDYRASEGYGRDWRTAIYRYMGGRDLDDQIDGVKYLIDSIGISKSRIGIYGGSYGGFMTLMALFTKPGVFKCGAALRSVTDWAHYNHGYTSNILNTPVEDSIAYRRSSPIYFAEGLRDRLLMLHGVVDVNVHFQDVIRLSQRLIELKKENWDLGVFPVEDHSFKESTSWANEYKRIYKMFDEELGE